MTVEIYIYRRNEKEKHFMVISYFNVRKIELKFVFRHGMGLIFIILLIYFLGE